MEIDRKVFVFRRSGALYPQTAPFNPHSRYPEYPFETSSEFNPVYEAVRGLFRIANMDPYNYGTPDWNPFKGLIRPGETVLLKPNLVKESHPRDSEGWKYVVTHGSIVRAVADFVFKALKGKGRVVLADAPQTDSSFSQLENQLGLSIIKEFYRTHGLDFDILDLRKEEWSNKDGVIVTRRRLVGDPKGYIRFDLGVTSEFYRHSGEGRYYGADYDSEEVNKHHRAGRHEYLIAATAIDADVIISLPKLKTHKKAGLTASLKNLVGLNGDKNWLPHHTEGDPSNGGDEHPRSYMKHRIERLAVSLLHGAAVKMPGLGLVLLAKARKAGSRIFGDTEEVIRSGNWWGNDTVWRMCIDLNKIIAYGEPDGNFRTPRPENRKRHYVMVDGILAGQGNGPMNPDPVQTGLLLFGTNPPSVDAACAILMGFDPDRIPIIRQAFRSRFYPLAEWDWRDVEMVSNNRAWNGLLPSIAPGSTFRFRPHFGWKGHIERV